MIYFLKARMDLINEVKIFGSDIDGLAIFLSLKVHASGSQQVSDNFSEEEKRLVSQLEELKLEGYLLNHIIMSVVPVEKSTLELCETVDNTFTSSSAYKNEDVNNDNDKIHELGRIGPYSNHFSTLCFEMKY